jgi:hypothetical protein
LATTLVELHARLQVTPCDVVVTFHSAAFKWRMAKTFKQCKWVFNCFHFDFIVKCAEYHKCQIPIGCLVVVSAPMNIVTVDMLIIELLSKRVKTICLFSHP